VPEYKRQLAAIGLTTRRSPGVGLCIAAQALLAGASFFTFGLDLLDMARAVAAFDLPMQLWHIFAHGSAASAFLVRAELLARHFSFSSTAAARRYLAQISALFRKIDSSR